MRRERKGREEEEESKREGKGEGEYKKGKVGQFICVQNIFRLSMTVSTIKIAYSLHVTVNLSFEKEQYLGMCGLISPKIAFVDITFVCFSEMKKYQAQLFQNCKTFFCL